MPAELPDLLDAMDLAVGQATDIIDKDVLFPFAQIARHARDRTGFLGETVLIALAGGTGSGKSSILNALAGERVAAAGASRPTTSTPLAWIPQNPEPGLVRLLDSLDIDRRVSHESFDSVAILDLPDTDSVVVDHRATVEALLPKIDAVIWVVDPEKYADRLLHDDFLAPLAGYQDQFLFVFNQIDRVSETDRALVVADLKDRLGAEGITDPIILMTAADPPTTSQIGIDAVAGFLAGEVSSKRTAIAKLIQDARELAKGLGEIAGVVGEPVEFDDRWAKTSDGIESQVKALVASGDAVREFERAGSVAARATGSGPLARVLAGLRRSGAGRALGAGPAELVPAARDRLEHGGIGRIDDLLSELVADVAFAVGGSFGAKVRDRFDDASLVMAARSASAATLDRAEPVEVRRRWWPVAAWLQTLLTIAVLGSIAWGWAQPEMFDRGRWPLPAIVGGSALIIGRLLASLVRRSGRRAGRTSVELFAGQVSEGVATELGRSTGVALRTLLRSRAELAGSLTEIGIAAAEVERRLLS